MNNLIVKKEDNYQLTDTIISELRLIDEEEKELKEKKEKIREILLKEMEDKNILKLENEDECYKFFEDIATINELKSLAQRMQVAKMLKEKKVYTEIAEVTGASTATISRVNKCLNYGEEGYNLVLDRLYPKSK